jgi:arginase
MAHRRHAAAQLTAGDRRAEAQLTAESRAPEIALIVVPYDSALFDTRMGAGPKHLVAGDLCERLRERGNEVRVDEITPDAGAVRAEIATAFDLNRRLASSVAAARKRGAVPITLAGNCNTAVGTIAGLGAERTGVLWFDAHGDFNTPETTVGGFLDGMALAIVTGRCWTRLASSVRRFAPVAEDRVILVGARDLDDEESVALARSGVVHLALDATSRLAAAVDALATRVEQLYVHVDLDVLDASEGQANGFAGGPGLTLAEVLRAIETAGSRIPIAGAAVTAYDPSFDRTGSIRRAGVAVAERIAERVAGSL